MNERVRLEGKVAQVLNTRELVITIGHTDGVYNGMRFAVLAATPTEIRDPDTNELLDFIDRPKVRVQAVDTRERVTVCRTYETRTVGSYIVGQIPWNIEPSGPREVVQTLKANDAAFPRPLDPDDSYVKIGDRVVQVMGEG